MREYNCTSRYFKPTMYVSKKVYERPLGAEVGDYITIKEWDCERSRDLGEWRPTVFELIGNRPIKILQIKRNDIEKRWEAYSTRNNVRYEAYDLLLQVEDDMCHWFNTYNFEEYEIKKRSEV